MRCPLLLKLTALRTLRWLLGVVVIFSTSCVLAQMADFGESFSAPQQMAGASQLLEVGRKAFLENRQDDAAKAFIELLNIDPNQVEALYRLAIINFQNKNHIDGMSYIQKAVSLEPNASMPPASITSIRPSGTSG